MKKTMLMAMMAILCGAASAAPGFVRAVFSGCNNITSDIWSQKPVVTELTPEVMYWGNTYSFPENTTYAYGSYMYMEGGVTYYFRGYTDDYVFAKVDDQVVIAVGVGCVESRGYIKFKESGWHKIDLRVSNSGGPGGGSTSTYGYNGFEYSTSENSGWKKFSDPGDGSCFQTTNPGAEQTYTVLAKCPYNYALSGSAVSITKYIGNETEFVVPSKLVGYTVTSISGSAFNGNASLTHVTIPSSVKTIGDSAFYGCTALKTVELSTGLTTIGGSAFYGCTSLTAVEVPDTVTSLGGSAFRCCTSLKTAKLPKGLTTTPNAIFMDDVALESVTMPDAPTKIEDHTFRNCAKLKSITVADTVGYIGSYAFYGCSSLPDVNIPDGVYTIGEHAFCNVLFSKVVIPDAVQSIGVAAFQNCPNLADVTLPVNLVTIPGYMLAGTKIKTIEIPDTVTSIGECAFLSCTELVSIDIPDGVSSMGGSVFSGCTKLSSVHLPANITSIPGGCFGGCTSLTKIHLPDKITTIGGNAFNGCLALAEINLPEGLARIEGFAFANCKSLSYLEIPATVTWMQPYYYSWETRLPFDGCSGLQRVVFRGRPPENVGSTCSAIGTICVCPREFGAEWLQAVGINNFTGYSTGSILTANVISSKIRENDPTIMDVVYKVTSKKSTVKVRVLAFEDGERSFAKVVRPETFVTDTNGVETACNVGDNVTPNVEHTISWRVSSDWKTKLAKVKFEVLACEGELLPLELMTIPASDQYGKMKISWNAISHQQLFDTLLWLYADHDAGLKLDNASLIDVATGKELANGLTARTDYSSRYDSNLKRTVYFKHSADYILNKMGYSILTGAPLTYANAETRLGLSPSGARQYACKIVEE